jgi:hypothetical protein
MKDFYVYIWLDPRKPGKFVYRDLRLDHEPFYVGRSYTQCLSLILP